MRIILHLLLFLFIAPCTAQGTGPTLPEAVRIPGSEVTFELRRLDGGTFAMGPGRMAVTLSPFSILAHEVTHDAYRLFQRRDNDTEQAATDDYSADAVTRPSPPYLDFTYGMGTRGGYPQVNVTQQAALRYAEWLYQKTGRFFRLPTEAEWEYACLAGAEEEIGEIRNQAWVYENGEEVFHKTGEKIANAWGLYDMLGNVSEWTLDDYRADYYTLVDTASTDPWMIPDRKHARTVRGGDFDTDAAEVGCRVRRRSDPKWQARDPQIPKSKWWNVDSPFLGFRLVSPVRQPSPDEITQFFAKAIVD